VARAAAQATAADAPPAVAAVQFSAVVKITYSNSDIVDSELVRMIDIGAAES
jgi:hypothetical protein